MTCWLDLPVHIRSAVERKARIQYARAVVAKHLNTQQISSILLPHSNMFIKSHLPGGKIFVHHVTSGYLPGPASCMYIPKLTVNLLVRCQERVFLKVNLVCVRQWIETTKAFDEYALPGLPGFLGETQTMI